MRLGYACINMTLAEEKVTVNRTMIKRTFEEKGIDYASSLALLNVIDFDKVVDWNISNSFKLYRMSSDMFPWMSEYEFKDLPDYIEIKSVLAKIGAKVKANGMRLTFHPGPFNVLATKSEIVLAKTLDELTKHAGIMDMIGLPQTPFAKINIHVGGAYGDKKTAIQRFCENFHLLNENVKSRLTVENDDKANMYSIYDLLEVHQNIGIPLVFDYFHHLFNTGGLTEREAFMFAYETWPTGIVPVFHFSSSRKFHENPAATATSHADFIYQNINTYGKEVDIMLEAKAKELAVKKYLESMVM